MVQAVSGSQAQLYYYSHVLSDGIWSILICMQFSDSDLHLFGFQMELELAESAHKSSQSSLERLFACTTRYRPLWGSCAVHVSYDIGQSSDENSKRGEKSGSLLTLGD